MGWLNAKLIITSIRFVDSSIWTFIDKMNIQAYINPFVGVKLFSRNKHKMLFLQKNSGFVIKKFNHTPIQLYQFLNELSQG